MHDRKAKINLQEESAALGLIQMSKEYEGQIHLLCFAPLTNIAIAMKADPQFPQRLQRIYAMGGNFHGIGNASISGEFNFLCDPEAAYVVLRHTPQPIVLVPWEICEEIEFSLVKKARAKKSGKNSSFDHILNYSFLQEWRKNVFGKIDDERIKFLNTIEYPWYSDPVFRTRWVACDQLIMAVFLDDTCVSKAEKFWVRFQQLYFSFYDK